MTDMFCEGCRTLCPLIANGCGGAELDTCGCTRINNRIILATKGNILCKCYDMYNEDYHSDNDMEESDVEDEDEDEDTPPANPRTLLPALPVPVPVSTPGPVSTPVPALKLPILTRFRNISKSIYTGYYADLGQIDIMEESTLENMKLTCIPHEGIHAKLKYIITIKFQEDGNWPLVYIDSEIYDKIKTSQYLQNKGKVGQHKGICIKKLGYGYTFTTNFKKLCGNKWENYIYHLICVFNNLQDFESGNGIKSSYKQILSV